MAGDTVGDWAERAATLPAALVRATPDAVKTGAAVLEAASRANLLAAAGGDGKLSRVRSGKGAKVDVSLSVQGTGSKAQGVVRPVGPVSLLEGDTRSHREPLTYAGTSGAGGKRRYATAGQQLAGGGTARRKRASRAGLIYVPGLGTFAGVSHPGTRGRRPVGRAFDTHNDEAGQAGLSVFTETVHRHLNG